MKKYLAFFLMALGLFCALTTVSAPARAAAYPDIEGHWAKPAIERWSDSGILKGYADGRFAPNDPISRAQLSEILYRVWGCKPNSVRTFTDVPANAWYYDGLTTMATYGVTLTDGDKARPDELLTREEAFYMVARAFRIGTDGDDNGALTQVTDGADVSPGYRGRLREMLARKYLKGTPDGKFYPKNTVTRAEVIQVMDNMFDLYIDKPGAYELGKDQLALVTSPGVVLRTSQKYIRVYAMNRALASGDFTLALPDGGDVRLYGVSDEKPLWKTEVVGDCVKGIIVHDGYTTVLSDPKQIPLTGFNSGAGTLAAPYHITTREQFWKIMELPRLHSFESGQVVYFFELDNDIDVGMVTESARGPGFFHFNGNGHTITYHMEGEFGDTFDDYGLFAYLTTNQSVRDLTVAGKVDVTLKDPTNIYQHMINFGGLVGGLDADLENCHSKMDITLRYPEGKMSYLNVGGLVGRAEECTMTNCTSEATVHVVAKGEHAEDLVVNAGGLVGVAAQRTYSVGVTGTSKAPDDSSERRTTLRQCGSSARVSVTGGNHAMVGGLLGWQSRLANDTKLTFEGYGVVEDCWSTADVSIIEPEFQGDCGGLVGHFAAGTIRQCWAAPTVQITANAHTFQNLGGIAGSTYQRDESHLTDCWVDASGLSVPDGGGHYGGITGRLNGEVARCFVLGNESFAPENAISYASWTDTKPTNCFSMAGKTAGDLAAFYETCGWNFAAVWDNSGTYPILRALPAEPQRAAQTP